VFGELIVAASDFSLIMKTSSLMPRVRLYPYGSHAQGGVSRLGDNFVRHPHSMR